LLLDGSSSQVGQSNEINRRKDYAEEHLRSRVKTDSNETWLDADLRRHTERMKVELCRKSLNPEGCKNKLRYETLLFEQGYRGADIAAPRS
jgi:hypothetical protein